MGKYLITGMGGTGKSQICKVLTERGYVAFDGDKVAGLTRWENSKTGEPIKVDHTKFAEHSKAAWNWGEAGMDKLFADNSQLFLCGSSSNEFSFFDRFDGVFILILASSVHEKRLKTRDSDYGKDPETIDWLLTEQPKFTQYALNMGAVAIDANGTAENTADQILSKVNEAPRNS